ncbi:MAG TPA: PEP-CTERM sorting domain-containing protein [Desulfobulbus sp.]|nr:PEP-CTERM sorting domain-containing protein [Desulfobulbus sp.]
MKKTFLRSAVIALAGVGLMAGSAGATPILTISDGSSTVTIQDGVGNSLDGIISYSGSIGAWDVTMSLASSYPAIGTLGAPEMHLTGSSVALTDGGTLTFTFEDKFSSWNNDLDGLISSFGGYGSGNVTFSTYLDDVQLANFGPVSGAFSDSMVSMVVPDYPDDYILKIVGVIDNPASGLATSFDGGIAPVPEPATMLLFGTGLAGLAGVVRKKKKQ